MFNNSGIIYSKSSLGQEENEISRIFDTNLKGAMLLAQEGARHMAAAGGGAIINIVSTADLRAGRYLSSCCASKACTDPR